MFRAALLLFAVRFAPGPAGRAGRDTAPAQRGAWKPAATIALACWALLSAAAAGETAGPVLGHPFTRFYSLEEIGNTSRGARLGFDPLGRLAVVNSSGFVVLNDSTWIDVGDKGMSEATLQRVVFGPDGQAYYGAFLSWGLVGLTPEGLLSPRSLLPTSYPKWVMASNFTEIVVTARGVYFGSFNGVVYWDRTTREHIFFEITGVTRIFALGETVFVSSHTQGIRSLDIANRSLGPAVENGLEEVVVDQVTAFDSGRVLLSSSDGRLMLFDGQRPVPWPGPARNQLGGRVSGLQRLPDGTIAVAINGRGLFLMAEDGEVRSSLTSPEYHRITDLAAREPGVLWVATENGVEKVLYKSPLSIFGQRLGLPVSWPQIVRWQDRIVVASGGRLYESLPVASGETTHFELIPDQPQAEVWGIAANGEQLLVGNSRGAFMRESDGSFTPVLSGIDVARLVMVSPELCYVIGSTEIAVLRRADGRWSEGAARVPGLGYPAVVQAVRQAAWIELGANRVARLTWDDGRLRTQVFEDFPWKEPRWVNIGSIGDTAVLSGLPDGRVFFDETTGAFVDAPRLKQLFAQAPYPISRMQRDGNGTIWACYQQGLLMIRPQRDGYTIDATTFGKISDHFPVVRVLPDGDVWLTTGQSLYHVDRRYDPPATPVVRQPVLVSMVDGRTKRVLSGASGPAGRLPRLKYTENNLIFRFFSGSYASRQAPAYEFRLNGGADAWVTLGTGSLLTLTDLREGDYRLDVRLAGAEDVASRRLSFEFAIEPPWYRSWYAYALYVTGGLLAISGLVRWSVYRTRSRNKVLEKLVEERTDELRAAMRQLNEETRNAATVEERNRLAGEIHDSLQQGLSGLMLQLDATLKLPELTGEVRSRLSVARNMVSFTRHEVQHAVWDMETPLLEGTELGEALKKITALIGPGTARVDITVAGPPVPLSSSTKHHLLRMAQEAITNAVRHASAKTIAIHLAYAPDAVSLAVTDDGNGFVPEVVLTKGIGHFGLRGLLGRAGKVGGELSIRSAPGAGTTVRIVVPVLAAEYSHAAIR